MTSLNGDLNSIIGLKIRLLRTKLKYSQEKLAELANISRVALSAIERGESKPTVNTLASIANALNVSLAELVDTSKVDLT